MASNQNQISSVEDIEKNFTNCMCSILYSSKRIDKDELTNSIHPSSEMMCCYPDGAEQYYSAPGGAVMYHKKSQVLFDIYNIFFMIKMNMIPLYLTSIRGNNYNFKRSSGMIQKGNLNRNTAITYSKSKKALMVYVSFYDHNKKIHQEKRVRLNEFIKLNNIGTITLKIPKLNKEHYKNTNFKIISEEIVDQIISKYNKKSRDHINNFVNEYFPNKTVSQYDGKITIILNNKNENRYSIV